MNNEIYIANGPAKTLQGLPKEVADNVVRTIDLLGEDVVKHSKVISVHGQSGEGLRVARAGAVRILFRYIPNSHSVIITDVSSKFNQETDEELVAAGLTE